VALSASTSVVAARSTLGAFAAVLRDGLAQARPRRIVRSFASLFVLVLAVAARAHAQDDTTPPAATPPPGHPSPWAFGMSGAGGAMVTDDQRDMLSFGGGGGLLHVALWARPFDDLGVDWIETEVGAGMLVVGPGERGQVGGVLDFGLGLRIAPRIDDIRPYASVAFGLALTGSLTRPVGTGAIGVAFQLSDELALGPELGVQHVIQWDGPGQTSDAVFLSFGAAFTYRPVPHPPVVPEVEVLVVTEERVTTVRAPAEELAFEPAPPPEPTRMEELSFLMTDAVCGEREPETLTLLPPVLFDHDHAELTAAGEVAMHDVLARVLEAPESAHIVVEGHADATGTSDYNDALASARASAVAEWLITRGVPRERLEQTSHGDRQPLVDGESDQALAPNRRVTIRIESPHDPDAEQSR